MKIKSINKTNRFKEVPFQVIKDDRDNDENCIHEVFTPSGWSKVLNFGFIKNGPSKVIKSNENVLKCDYGHCLLIDRNNQKTVVRADQLDQEIDRIYSYNNKLIDFTLEDGSEDDFYDITIDDPHWWYTASFVSHNSIVMCNNAVTSWMGHGSGGRVGQDVLLVTFELNYIKTGMRCLGVLGRDIPMDQLTTKQNVVTERVEKLKQTYDGRIFISELPPESCSVDHLYALLDNLKKNEGWKPDVIIVDYMDLMVSRNKHYNNDMYERQRNVASELRGLAIQEKVVIYTATQTNRNPKDAQDGAVAGLDRVADSYAKQFSMDYIINIAQSTAERAMVPAIFRMTVNKNRNGPRDGTITCEINYNTMLAKEINS